MHHYIHKFVKIKKKPRRIDKHKPSKASVREPKAIPLWAQVTANPETINKTVLKSGYPVKGITIIPTGGHIEPNKIDGQIDEWKKAQKNPKNNINSETRNNKNPRFKPFFIIKVW